MWPLTGAVLMAKVTSQLSSVCIPLLVRASAFFWECIMSDHWHGHWGHPLSLCSLWVPSSNPLHRSERKKHVQFMFAEFYTKKQSTQWISQHKMGWHEASPPPVAVGSRTAPPNHECVIITVQPGFSRPLFLTVMFSYKWAAHVAGWKRADPGEWCRKHVIDMAKKWLLC